MAENAYASAIFLLLNKTDYDIDTEIRTVELLKAIPPLFFFTLKLKLLAYFYNTELGENELSVVDILTSTILSTNFWPPIQDEPLVLPGPVDKLLSDYAKKKVLKVIGKGNLPQVIRIVPYSAIQLFAYETYKKLFSREDGELSVLGSLGAGACAGMTSTLVLAIPWIPFSRNGRLIWTVYP
uniref:Uncharacterized protein n=1 Tax=Brassica oleracea TaxID=3712 RepID=A0A3P6DTA9_BRAOL|nr:unnamed protein product [Brassica oleracea]